MAIGLPVYILKKGSAVAVKNITVHFARLDQSFKLAVDRRHTDPTSPVFHPFKDFLYRHLLPGHRCHECQHLGVLFCFVL